MQSLCDWHVQCLGGPPRFFAARSACNILQRAPRGTPRLHVQGGSRQARQLRLPIPTPPRAGAAGGKLRTRQLRSVPSLKEKPPAYVIVFSRSKARTLPPESSPTRGLFIMLRAAGPARSGGWRPLAAAGRRRVRGSARRRAVGGGELPRRLEVEEVRGVATAPRRARAAAAAALGEARRRRRRRRL